MKLYEMELPEIDINAPGFLRDPHAKYAEARSQSWIARFQDGYVLLDYDDMKTMLTDDRCRTPNQDITKLAGVEKGSPFERWNNHFLFALNGEPHDRLRKLVAPAFTPREATRFRPFMRETIQKILDQVEGQSECDFSALAAQYPITVMCHILGVNSADIARFEDWLITLANLFTLDKEILEEVNGVLANLFDYVDELIEGRRAPGEKPDDLLQTLVDLTTDGDNLSDEELRLLLINLLSGGYDTTKNQLIFIMKVLIDNPEEWQLLADNPDRVKPFIEEAFRFRNPVNTSLRVANEDIEYRDIVIPKDTMMMLPLTFSGHDASKNEAPNEFRADRNKKHHLTFGQGVHFCLGTFIARALLEEALPIIVERLRKPKPAGEATVPDHFMGLSSYDELPISFEPVPSQS